MPINSPVLISGPAPEGHDPAPVAYSIKGTKRASGLSRSMIYRLIQTGQLVARKCGARTIVMDDDLRRCLAALPPIAPKE